MKSFLLSALAVSLVSASTSTKYYIGNYSVFGTVSQVVPYPLDVCLANGGGGGYNYVIFSCVNETITQHTYAVNDTTCAKSYTTSSWKAGTTPGVANYASCSGSHSYMELGQYLESCAEWKSGDDPSAITTVSMNACSYVETMGQVKLYSKTTCTGEGYTTTVHAGDYTCSTNQVQTNTTGNGCYFFKDEEGLPIYNSIIKCVSGDVVQRCTSPLTQYQNNVTFQDLTSTPNYTKLYTGLFPYATVAVDQTTLSTKVILDLSFCTEWEDQKYGSSVEELGKTTATGLNQKNAVVCSSCTHFSCSNSSLCGNDNFCSATEQCATLATTTTTTKSPSKSASTLSAGIASLLIVLSCFLSAFYQ